MLALGLKEAGPGLGGSACARRAVAGREGRKGESADELYKDRKKRERKLSSDYSEGKATPLSARVDALNVTLPQILHSALFKISYSSL